MFVGYNEGQSPNFVLLDKHIRGPKLHIQEWSSKFTLQQKKSNPPFRLQYIIRNKRRLKHGQVWMLTLLDSWYNPMFIFQHVCKLQCGGVHLQ
jgi:hypothetical protein